MPVLSTQFHSLMLHHSLRYCSTNKAAQKFGGGVFAPPLVVAVSSGLQQQQQQPTTRISPRSPRPENAPGDFFVDHTCIDCDTCRWMAPDTFTRIGHQSAVYNQPASPTARVSALQALLSCPTASIRTEKPPSEILSVHGTFPLPVDEERIPGVYLCGYHSEKSFGATSYLITRPDGNILIDSPKYTERLARRIEALGGVRFMFLTHMDDVADHAAWHQRFGCDRILHKEDVRSNTEDVEIKLDGGGPWNLGPEIDLIHTPGHTMGCVCLLYKPLGILFSGDHLAMSEDGFSMFRQYGRSPVELQIESVRALLRLEFNWILPGHRRRAVFKDAREKNAAIEKFLEAEGYKM